MHQNGRSRLPVPDLVGRAVACYECISGGIVEIQVCSLALSVGGLGGEDARFSDDLRRLQQAALHHAAGTRNLWNLLSIKVSVTVRLRIVGERSGERGREREERERERER